MSRPRSMHDRMRSEKKRSKHCGQRAARSFHIIRIHLRLGGGVGAYSCSRDCPQGLPTGIAHREMYGRVHRDCSLYALITWASSAALEHGSSRKTWLAAVRVRPAAPSPKDTRI